MVMVRLWKLGSLSGCTSWLLPVNGALDSARLDVLGVVCCISLIGWLLLLNNLLGWQECSYCLSSTRRLVPLPMLDSGIRRVCYAFLIIMLLILRGLA